MKVDYIQHCGSDLSVVNAARVSFDKESDFISDNQLADKDKKLIKYLSDHDHTSPFNHAFLTVRVKAPIFVARQLVKHKFMPWNEISPAYQYAYQCYTNMLADGVCPEQARMVLPQSVYTEWYWSGTLGAFLDMLKLRLKPDTQQETREIAKMIAKIIKKYWPVSYETILKEIA